MGKVERFRPNVAKLSIFGSRPVLEDEDNARYDQLLDRMYRDVKPNDIIEELWVRDIVDRIWEMFRWRELLTKIVQEVIDNMPFTEIDDMGRHISVNNGVSLSEEMGRAERLEHLIAASEQRLSAIFREIDRRRDRFAQSLRDSLKQAEFQMLQSSGSDT
jgi:hypothetical protein